MTGARRLMDRVADAECLYRSVKKDHCQADPVHKVTSGAFLDPQYRPSVDRAHLRNHDPSRTLQDPTDGIVMLVTAEVRAIEGVRRSAPDVTYRVDVEPRPEPGNPAHAEIYLDPAPPNRGAFDKLRLQLARLANKREWAIKPSHLP